MKTEENSGGGDGHGDHGSIQQSTKSFGGRNGGGSGNGNPNVKVKGDSNETMPTMVHQ
jgi:hypothetical protein